MREEAGAELARSSRWKSGLWQRSPNQGAGRSAEGSRGWPRRGCGSVSDITPIARRDWDSLDRLRQAKQDARTSDQNACDMLAKGKRRPCCFDSVWMYITRASLPRSRRHVKVTQGGFCRGCPDSNKRIPADGR